MKTYSLLDATKIAKVGDDWLTPLALVNALGPFDLDPCASVGQPWPTARHMNTVRDGDGLQLTWEGYVFCNPPYGRGIRNWVERACEHRNGILLTAAAIGVGWYERVWRSADAIFFTYERERFYHPGSGTLCENRWFGLSYAAFGSRAVGGLTRLKLRGALVTKWIDIDK